MTAIPNIVPGANYTEQYLRNHAAHRLMGARTQIDTIDAAQGTLSRFLTGKRPAALQKALTIKGSNYAKSDLGHLTDKCVNDMLVHSLTIQTLALMGIDCRALGVAMYAVALPPLAMKVDGVRVLAILRSGKTEDDPIRMDIEVTLSPGRRWIPSLGLIDMEDTIPESLLMAVKGRPLQSLISHPLLDKLELTIEDAFDDHGTATVHVPRTADTFTLSSLGPMGVTV